jgi:GST-like protein
MIELHYWPTPNGHKITMFLEETGTPYQIVPVNIGAGDQFKPEFLRISPNNRMPAIIDREPAGGGAPVSVFESGAILLYLAEKTGRLLPSEPRARIKTLEWLFWQVANLGPMAGQNSHFVGYAKDKIQYAIDRYVSEVNRLYGVLNRQLAQHEFVAGPELSIADLAIYPWIVPWERQRQQLSDFTHLKRWLESIAARPATIAAYERGKAFASNATASDEARKILFGQTAASVDRAAQSGSGSSPKT